jgi:hypothetical protein
MHDTAKTVIRGFKTEIDYEGLFEYPDKEKGIKGGYYAVLYINGLTLRYDGATYLSDVRKDFQKCLNKGAKKVQKPAYMDEQETAYAKGCEKVHGETVYTVLAGTESGSFVWDSVKNAIVNKNELTQM